MKVCKRCGEEKDKSLFSPFRKSKDGLFTWCKACNSSCQRERERRYREEYGKGMPKKRKQETLKNQRQRYYSKHRDRIRKSQNARYENDEEFRFRVKIGVNALRWKITPEEYLARISRPCDICGDRLDTGAKMSVDHSHLTGKLRGTLCAHCNNGLGCFRDNIERLQAAVAYLQHYA